MAASGGQVRRGTSGVFPDAQRQAASRHSRCVGDWARTRVTAQPAVLDIVSDAVLEYFKKHPAARNISVSCTDTHSHCECPKCEAINRREGCPTGSHLDFVNKVADRVKEKYPDKRVGTLAYYHTRKPPKNDQAARERSDPVVQHRMLRVARVWMIRSARRTWSFTRT